jgi:hypothetical protein
MKILISNDGPHAFYYIRLGLARAFTAADHEVILWEMGDKPVFDAFDELEPDLFIGQTYNANEQVIKAIKERPHLKVIMKGGDWGELSDGIGPEYGVLHATEKEKRAILDLHEETGLPNYIYIHYHPSFVEKTHGSWAENGIPIHPNMSASDVFDYTNGQKLPEFESDICFIGGYWEYKAQNLNKYILKLCEDYKYRIKIFGNSPWPVAQYCGFIPNNLVKHALASATICPQIHEPHSNVYGFDVIERIFKLLSNKCFCVSDYVAGLDMLFGDDVVMVKTPEEFKERIDYFLQNPEDRQGYIDRGYEAVMNEHTYFHRAADIFHHLGMNDEATNVLNKYQDIRKQIENG